MVGNTPPRGENDKVGNGHTWSGGFGSQHGKDRRILEKDQTSRIHDLRLRAGVNSLKGAQCRRERLSLTDCFYA